MAHLFATLHLLQLRVAGQATHPIPLVKLQVSAGRQHPETPMGRKS